MLTTTPCPLPLLLCQHEDSTKGSEEEADSRLTASNEALRLLKPLADLPPAPVLWAKLLDP